MVPGPGMSHAHMRTHTGYHPYACPEPDCDYAAADPSSLRAHMRTHTDERPHACPEPDCNYAATTSGNLLRHMRTHTGEHSYACPQLLLKSWVPKEVWAARFKPLLP